MVYKTKRQPTEWEKINNPTSDRGLISKIFKKKIGIDLNRGFSTEKSQIAERHLRYCLTSLILREMQIKTSLRYYLPPVRMAKIKNTDKSLEKRWNKNTSPLWVGVQTYTVAVEISMVTSQKIRNQSTSRPI